MAESRRVQLTTLSQDVPPSSDSSAPVHRGPSGALRGEEQRSERPADSDTVRLVLSLFDPDERSFPEFSYSQLLDAKINQTKDEVPLSRLEERKKKENDEVAAIARKLERKYGGKPKKKKDRIQDLIDIGYGYDEEDSFIDNSEAYDEFVPASITTKFGGFYVNSGVLQFRQASDTETDDLSTEEKAPECTKKRKLSGGQDKPKKKQCGSGEEMNSDMGPKLSTTSIIAPDNEMKIKKKKKAAKTLSVTSMLKKFQKEKERERQKLEKTNQKASGMMGETTFSVSPADAAGGGGSGQTDPLLSLIGSTNDHALIQAASTLDFDIDLDSLLDVSEETSSPQSLPHPATEAQLTHNRRDDQLNVISDAKAQTSNTNSQPKPHAEQIHLLSEVNSASPHQCAPLPEGLPPGLEESIRKLTKAARTSEGESKLKFFNPDINSLLLDIELQCREQGGQLRSKVYTHLSSFLPCSRDTLLKRVKKLFITHVEPPGVKDPVQKLKEAIGRSMPEQIACFHETCQAYEQTKTAKATEEDNVEEKAGKRGPRKMFKWNEDIRECLGHVLKEKVDKYQKERKESQDMEDHLKTFLVNEIKSLWPKGWMQSRVLIRESKKMLGAFTSLPVKKAKSEKKQSINGASTLSDSCHSLQGALSLSGEPSRGTDQVFIEDFNISKSVPFGVIQRDGAALRKDATKKVKDLNIGFASHANSDRPVATSAPTHSLLDILADQALAREEPLALSQELLAEAVAKYRRAVQHWSFSVDTKSPPVVPPPPQSSPVGFPASRAHQVVLPQLLLAGDTRHMDADGVQIISDDDDDVIIQ